MDDSGGCVLRTQTALAHWYNEHREHIRVIIWAISITALGAYVAYCMYYDFPNSVALLVLTILVVVGCVYYVIKAKAGTWIAHTWQSRWSPIIGKVWIYGQWSDSKLHH